jgi:hypothetical protein
VGIGNADSSTSLRFVRNARYLAIPSRLQPIGVMTLVVGDHFGPVFYGADGAEEGEAGAG